MTTYWITFRIAYETVGGRSYDDRYEAFTNTVVANASNYWAQTTSFSVIESSLSIDTLTATLKREFSPSKDLFLIRQVDTKSAKICGQNDDNDIFTLMPYLERA
jgi:hypothetical protein